MRQKLTQGTSIRVGGMRLALVAPGDAGMFFFILVQFSILLTAISATASEFTTNAMTYFVKSKDAVHGQEAVLALDYEVNCKGVASFQGFTGKVRYDGRWTRFELFRHLRSAEIALGALDATQDVRIQLDSSPNCMLKRFDALVRPVVGESDSSSIERLVHVHSPFIVVREDQYEKRLSDLPLTMAYAVTVNETGRMRIQYTVVFSDEDSLPKAEDVAAAIGRYGRRTDIEWVYEVEFDEQYRVIGRWYHSDVFKGLGHTRKRFKGKFLSGTNHPILFNARYNNVFSDKPRGKQKKRDLEGYHLVASRHIPQPLAREWLMFESPWMFSVSDWEINRENRLTHAASEYLYIFIEGKLRRGAFAGRIRLHEGNNNSEGVVSAPNDVDRLGEDLWGRQTFTALPVGGEKLANVAEGIVHGVVEFVSTSWLRKAAVDLRKLRFFRLVHAGEDKTPRIEEISHRFDCNYAGISTTCRF